ncbi:recombinase family protein [Candidatus Sulfurimonas marisnigri]|uniref:Recombinase family protein n=1 Tax=Candidatus Sulfurimonas marisnigri TaxID=2740405 RepID=A0A7S7M1I0_9BACT|nr:recombinase family protein [Candidatus Sulfurimonas marisnigri]QOY54529.1 recombinase family protein [Candidatus Sulfurimonas marisnigri]
MKVGYARVSSSGQNLQSQIESLQAIGCEKIFQEKVSGRQYDNREQLQEAIDFVRSGDTFVVTRLDRCSRSVKDLHQIIETLNSKEVDFKATQQELDTSSSSGRLMIGLLSIVSAFETDLRAERQAEGISSALKRGVKFGAKSKFDEERTIQAIDMQSRGITNQEIADGFGIGRSTLLRYIKQYKNQEN